MSFFEQLSSLALQAKDLALKYSPSALTPEKRFAKACISACALLTMADGEAEATEVEMASEFIMGVPEIKKYFDMAEAHEIFALQLTALETASKKGNVMFLMETNKIIAEIHSSVDDESYVGTILAVAETMATSNSRGVAGKDELAVINTLKAALTA